MLKRAACLLCSMAVAFGASACGTSISVVTNGLAQGPTITIGVAADQPGLGYLHGGEYSGFDISVAQYVAK
ncbi:MAG TPA: ABC transporter substrate-binding protein, partial [Bifidobacterium sp.]|nr:ABC transporter substrate-binding protein [Bifidobacterium sp.]